MTQLNSIFLASDIGYNDISQAHANLVQRRFASDLSVRLNCPVDLIYVKTINDTSKRLVLNDKEKKILINENRERFSSVMRNFSIPGRLRILYGSPAHEITNAINEDPTAVEAIIMGTQGLNNWNRLIQGSVSEVVTEEAQRPVFLFGPQAIAAEYSLPALEKIRITACTDLSGNNREAENYLVSLAQRLDAKLLVYHSLPLSIQKSQQQYHLVSDFSAPLSEFIEATEELVYKKMNEKIERIRAQGIECEPFIDYGTEPFEQALLNSPAGLTDIICMGNHKRTFLESLFGSKLTNLLRVSSVPILSIRY